MEPLTADFVDGGWVVRILGAENLRDGTSQTVHSKDSRTIHQTMPE